MVRIRFFTRSGLRVAMAEGEWHLDARVAAKALLTKYGFKTSSLYKKVKDNERIRTSRTDNLKARRPGNILLGRTQRTKAFPVVEGFLPIVVSKGKSALGEQLSPFRLDVPFEMNSFATVDGRVGSARLSPGPVKLEMAWQSCKAMKGEDLESFLTRKAAIYSNGVVRRRYVPKEYETDVMYFGRQERKYIESRAYYLHLFEKLATQTNAYKLIRDLVQCGFNVLILGPDAFDKPLDEQEALECVEIPFGHERALRHLIVSDIWGKAPLWHAYHFWPCEDHPGAMNFH